MKASVKGFTLIELMAASAIAMIVLSLFVGAYQTVVQHYAMAELPQRGDQIATAMYYYYLDTGVYPPGNDSDGLRNLYQNVSGLAGWNGPYLRLQMEDGTVDPWGRPFIYRSGTTPAGRPVFLILSLGRNGVLDSDLSTWTRPNWDPSGDDWARVFSERAPITIYEDKTYNTLRFVAGMIYNANPGSAPATFNAGAYRDAWRRPVVYRRCNNNAAIVYSFGANGRDDSNLGATICSTARKQMDDLFVALIWNAGRAAGTGTPPEDCSRWLPPPWQPNPPGGTGNQPPWQPNPPGGANNPPPWNSQPPGRPWRDPNMPCRGVDDLQSRCDISPEVCEQICHHNGMCPRWS